MAAIRCPSCGDEIVPFPVEPEGDEGPTRYICPTCRDALTIGVVDAYLALEEEEASG
jgi:DNA-directed RNA polymerase subunit RPC12/RpoP